jgi:hypothetical protein
MITAKEAINIANRELVSVFQAQDVQIEEYAMDKDKLLWLVTLSYGVPSADPDHIANLIPIRKWKTVSIGQATGTIEAVVSGTAWELMR